MRPSRILLVLALMAANRTAHAQISGFSWFSVAPVYVTSTVAGSDGNMWFVGWSVTDNSAFAGCMTLAGTPQTYNISTKYPNSYPEGATVGPDGALWFTDFQTSAIGRIPLPQNPSLTCPSSVDIVEYPTKTPNSGPAVITVGPDASLPALWFTEEAGRIGRITTAFAQTDYPIPVPNSIPKGITAGPDGMLWFTDYGTSAIGQMDETGNFIGEYAIPTPKSLPYRITSGPVRSKNSNGRTEGPFWFAESIGKIGRLTTADHRFGKEIAVTPGTYGPVGITPGPDGSMWFVTWDETRSYLGQITQLTDTNPKVTYSPFSAVAEFPTTGPDGAVWLGGEGQIGRAIPSLRRNAIDLSVFAKSVPTSSQLALFQQAGVQYAVLEGNQHGDPISSQLLGTFSGSEFKTAAYCFLYLRQGDPTGSAQVQACLKSIDTPLNQGILTFVALDVEEYTSKKNPPPPYQALAARLDNITQAINALRADTRIKKILIYTNSGNWIFLTNNDARLNALALNYDLWNGAQNSFIGYVDPAGNLGENCAQGTSIVPSLNPTPRGGSGLPDLTAFTAFGPWTQQAGTQYDIGGNIGVNAACLFGAQVDFDVFNSSLFP